MFTLIKLTFKLVKLMTIFAVIAIIIVLAACKQQCKNLTLDKDFYSLSQDDLILIHDQEPRFGPIYPMEYTFVAIYQDINKGMVVLQTVEDRQNQTISSRFLANDLMNLGFVEGQAKLLVKKVLFNREITEYFTIYLEK